MHGDAALLGDCRLAGLKKCCNAICRLETTNWSQATTESETFQQLIKHIFIRSCRWTNLFSPLVTLRKPNFWAHRWWVSRDCNQTSGGSLSLLSLVNLTPALQQALFVIQNSNGVANKADQAWNGDGALLPSGAPAASAAPRQVHPLPAPSYTWEPLW